MSKSDKVIIKSRFGHSISNVFLTHEGQQYQVEKLDFDDKKAYVRKVNVDYYTDANLAVDLKVIDVFREDNTRLVSRNCGEVMVTSLVTMPSKSRSLT